VARLNQIIAIEKGIKSGTYAKITEIHNRTKPEMYNGFEKRYEKIDEASEDLPPDRKHIEITAQDVLTQVRKLTSELMQVTARKDWTNCVAKANIVVDGQAVLHDVPVTYLLFLEKQLTDLQTLITKMPVLDPAERWESDPASGLFRSAEPTRTHRTKKVQEAIVKYPATVEHPAQTELITKDVLAGHWVTTKFSGAMQKPRKEAIVERVNKLLQAVKQAREAANGADEVDGIPDVGDAVFNYVLRD